MDNKIIYGFVVRETNTGEFWRPKTPMLTRGSSNNINRRPQIYQTSGEAGKGIGHAKNHWVYDKNPEEQDWGVFEVEIKIGNRTQTKKEIADAKLKYK